MYSALFTEEVSWFFLHIKVSSDIWCKVFLANVFSREKLAVMFNSVQLVQSETVTMETTVRI